MNLHEFRWPDNILKAVVSQLHVTLHVGDAINGIITLFESHNS